jgi:hypothetical protein
MKVRTELKAGQEVAVAVGAAAVNVASIREKVYSSISGGGDNMVAVGQTASITQSATASNTGAVSASA